MVACCGSGSVVGKGGQPHDDDDDDHDDHDDEDGDRDGDDVYPKPICMRLHWSGSSPSPPPHTQQTIITNQPH
jgi:hypothetical protein